MRMCLPEMANTEQTVPKGQGWASGTIITGTGNADSSDQLLITRTGTSLCRLL